MIPNCNIFTIQQDSFLITFIYYFNKFPLGSIFSDIIHHNPSLKLFKTVPVVKMPPQLRSRSGTPKTKHKEETNSANPPLTTNVLPPGIYVPPYPIQKFNNLIHNSEIIGEIAYSIFWSSVLLLSPFLAIFLLFVALPINVSNIIKKQLALYRWSVRNSFNSSGKNKGFNEITGKVNAELIVVITGCDTGFGRELALDLFKNGVAPSPPKRNRSVGVFGMGDSEKFESCKYDSACYTIFATCYSEGSTKQISELADSFTSKTVTKNNTIVPFQMDVTSDSSCDNFQSQLESYILKKDNKNNKVFFHSLINNAGIGTPGLVDWLPLASPDGQRTHAMKNDMEVNYWGAVRSLKACLPTIKRQACMADRSNRYRGSVIVNVTSMAGLVSMAGMSAYSSSKFACEAWSTALRGELWKPWGVSVTTCNPSFHKTPLVDGIGGGFDRLWKNTMTDEKKKEYGASFFHDIKIGGMRSSKVSEWDSTNVVTCIARAVRDRHRGQGKNLEQS